MRALWIGLTLFFATSATAQVTTFGQPCDLRSGLPPAIFVTPPPATNVDVRLYVLAVPPSVPATLLIGTSSTSWGTINLPMDLTWIGMPGCQLLVTPDVALPLPASGTVILPTSRLPVGATAFVQAIVVDGTTGMPSGLTSGLGITNPDPFPPFSIAMLPDTQFYSQYANLHFHFLGQTDWVARNLNRVAFAVQAGDIVQSGARYRDQWVRADQAIDRWNSLLPHAVALGNHDFDSVGNKTSATEFIRWFGPTRFAGETWYGGASADSRNSYQLFDGRGETYLHLTMEWRPSDDAIAWAQGVLTAHPGLPAIVTTHEHLSTGNPAPWRTAGTTPDDTGDNAAQDLHRKLFEPFPQVFLVMCGHIHGTGLRADTTPLGRTVHAMLADYQSDPNGGAGFFRTLEFRTRSSTIAVRTLSATYVPGTGPDYTNNPFHNFDLPYDAVTHRAELASTSVLRLREGQDLGHGAYQGTQDTRIGDGAAGGTLPGQAYGGDDLVWCDGDGDHTQGLVRFDALVGPGAGQVPPGTLVRRAILTLTTEGTNSNSGDGGRLHRMTLAWSEASTWNSLGSGIQLGLEALASHDADSAGEVDAKGTRSFDVTTSVQAWVNGALNHGWVFVANGNDGWAFRTSEWRGLVERPMLTVTW